MKLKKGIEDYKRSLAEYIRGDISFNRFKGIRVPWGVYSQRGSEKFMVRVRITAQSVEGKQLETLAKVAERYSPAPLHLTTRGDIQIHSVEIADTANIFDELWECKLSSRGGGGNTVRNIMCCPLAGVCKDEEFDIRKYPITLTEFLLRDVKSFNMPRKYKISFSCCFKDCALATVNDLGFIAKKKDESEGFAVYVGGGMGSHPRVGDKLEDFVLPQDAVYIAEAVKRVFYKHGDRKNKHQARLRFLIEKITFSEFKKLYVAELNNLKKNEEIHLIDIKFKNLPLAADIPPAAEIPPAEKKEVECPLPTVKLNADFELFKKYNISAQKQDGYYYIVLRIKLGDISVSQLKALSEISMKFNNVEFRTSRNQNMYILNVEESNLFAVYNILKKSSLDAPYAMTVVNTVNCKGSATCNLGICNSPALAIRLTDELERAGLNYDLLKDAESVSVKKNGLNDRFLASKSPPIDIRISGCSNSCGQHVVAAIGLAGLVRKINSRPAPFYNIFTGGRVEMGKTLLAENPVLVPAKNVIEVVKKFLLYIQKEAGSYGDFYKFLEEKGKLELKNIADKYSYVPDYSDDRSYYRDYGSDKDFSLKGIAPGECGAGVIDMIEDDINIAEKSLRENKLRKALAYAARALLVVKGLEPLTEEETVSNFVDHFVKPGIASEKFMDLPEVFMSESPQLEYTKDFVDEVKSIYKRMDNNFNFPPAVDLPLKKELLKEQDEISKEIKELDLKGVKCPINYVKSKLFIEQMEKGEYVDILLDEGEPIKNVPPSLKNDGNEIIEINKEADCYRIRVKKGGS